MFRKPLGITARLRRQKSGRLKRAENKNKEEVRERDRVCRFPLCPCHQFNLFLEVSHREHKGMGGDPTGELSQPWRMILVCNWRHKESQWSIDKETIRWVPLTDRGSNGPVRWEAYLGGGWRELAIEVEPGEIDRRDSEAGAFVDVLVEELRKHWQR